MERPMQCCNHAKRSNGIFTACALIPGPDRLVPDSMPSSNHGALPRNVTPKRKNTLEHCTLFLSAPLISSTRSYVCLCMKACRRQRSRSESVVSAIHNMCFVVLQAHFYSTLFQAQLLREKFSRFWGWAFRPQLRVHQKLIFTGDFTTPVAITPGEITAPQLYVYETRVWPPPHHSAQKNPGPWQRHCCFTLSKANLNVQVWGC